MSLVVVGIAVVVVLLVLLGLPGMQRAILFPAPPLPSRDRPELPGLVVLALPSGAEAWLLPPQEPRGPAPVLVFAHGNGELIDHWAPHFETPRSWGLSVLLVEYPGYGRSAGQPSWESIALAMEEALAAASAHEAVDAERWIAYGRSLGGGAVAALASRQPPAAMILESTFTSVRAMASGLGLPGFLVFDEFDNAAVVEALERPLLILHGMHDSLIPLAHATTLHELAADSRLEILACGHNDCPRPWRQIHAFLVEQGLVAEAHSSP